MQYYANCETAQFSLMMQRSSTPKGPIRVSIVTATMLVSSIVSLNGKSHHYGLCGKKTSIGHGWFWRELLTTVGWGGTETESAGLVPMLHHKNTGNAEMQGIGPA